MTNRVSDFAIGQRVQMHPATDAWMRGQRYGTVVSYGRTYVWVCLDNASTANGKRRPVHPDNLLPVEG